MDNQGAQSQYTAYDPRNGGLSRRATDEAASSSNSLAPYDRTNYPPRSSTDPGEQNQAAPKPKRSGKICGKCGEGLTGQLVRALGDTYHLECFTCHVRHPCCFLEWRNWALACLCALQWLDLAHCCSGWTASNILERLISPCSFIDHLADLRLGLRQNCCIQVLPRS